MNQSALKIILVDENMGRSAILRRALQDKGHEVISRLEGSGNLANSVEITHADVVIVNADIPDEAVFANFPAVFFFLKSKHFPSHFQKVCVVKRLSV